MNLDTSYTINPETLREEPNNADDMRRMMEYHQAQAALPELEVTTKIRQLGMAGAFARILNEMVLAEHLLAEAVALCETNDYQRELFINRIRLAHVYQWMGDFETSTGMFDDLLAQPLSLFEDFLLQHAGKNAFDMGNYEQALTYFMEALVLRKAKGQADLIASTQMAIAAVHQRFI